MLLITQDWNLIFYLQFKTSQEAKDENKIIYKKLYKKTVKSQIMSINGCFSMCRLQSMTLGQQF